MQWISNMGKKRKLTTQENRKCETARQECHDTATLLRQWQLCRQ